MADNQVKLVFGYKDTDFARSIVFSDVPDSLLSGVKTKVKAVNASLVAGNAGGLSTFFQSDAGDNFTGITAAQIISDDITYIDISGGEEE